MIEYEFVTSILADPLQLLELPKVSAQMLEDEHLREIYGVILHNEGKITPAILLNDLQTTSQGIRALDEFAVSFGLDYKGAVDELFQVGLKSGSAEPLAERIRDKALTRSIQASLGSIKRDQFGPATDYAAALNNAIEHAIVRMGGTNNADALALGADEALSDYLFQLDNPGKITGLRVGMGDFDLAVGGFKSGELLLLCAHSGEGKTMLMLHQATEAATTPQDMLGRPARALYFSLEMNRRQIADRMIRKLSQVDLSERIADAATRQRVTDAAGKLKQMNTDRNLIIVESSAAQSLDQICRELVRARAQDKIDIAFIDYAQLVSVRADSKYNAMATISQRLKQMALQLDIPIVLAAQLNREALRETKAARPRLYHIADGMDLVRSADMLNMIWTPAKHLQGNDVGDWAGIAVILTEKRRSGPTLPEFYYHAEHKYSRLRPCNQAETKVLNKSANQEILRAPRKVIPRS